MQEVERMEGYGEESYPAKVKLSFFCEFVDCAMTSESHDYNKKNTLFAFLKKVY